MVLSSQMLHALRMTSFWSPHMPADPPPCSESSLTRARVPAVVPSLTGLHSSLQISPLIGGHQRSLPPTQPRFALSIARVYYSLGETVV